MATYITSAQWRQIEPSLRERGISAADYMRRNDVYVDDRMAAKQGTPSAPAIGNMMPSTEPNKMAVYGDNVDDTEDTEDTEDIGATGTNDFAARPGLSTLAGILSSQRQSIGDLYDKITQNIEKRYRKPDINDLLIAVGTGMMSAPGENDSGGFGGAVQRGLRGIGTYAQSRRDYETNLNKMLSEVEIDKAKQMAGLQSKYLTSAAAALKPVVPRVVGTQVVGGKVVAVTQEPGTGTIGTTQIGEAPLSLKPVSGVTSGGQPVFTDNQGRTVFADGTPVTRFDEKPKPISATEQRQIWTSEDAVESGSSTVRALQEALQLNGQAFEGPLTGWRKTVGQTFGSDDPRYQATENFDNIVITNALQSLKALLGTQFTAAESKAYQDLQAISKYPRGVREQILQRALAVVNRRVARETERLERLKGGGYSSRGGSRVGQPSRPRVINWGQ